MSVGKIMCDLQKVIEEDLNFQVSTLKDEISDAFAKHRKQLASRELWLLNQVDSIKNQTLVMVAKQKTTLAEIKTRLEELTRFCEDTEDVESTTQAADTIAQLQKKLQKSNQSESYGLPMIKFIHDESLLRDTIFSYGRFETKSCIDSDETDSFTSEKSWDVVCEKVDEFDDKDETYVDGKEALNFQSKCCGDVSSCCKQSYEIEDIDLSRILSGNDFLQSKETCFDSPNVLRGFCKANEVCSSLTECVCDTPCLELKSVRSTDPVLELQEKMSALYRDFEGNSHVNTNDYSDKFDAESIISESPSFTTDSCDPLAQISNAVQSILNMPESDGVTNKHIQQTNMANKDIVSDIHMKLQNILDGEDCHRKQNELMHSISYKTLPWELKCHEDQDCDSGLMQFDEVRELHERLQNIFQEGMDTSVANNLLTAPCLEIDPVMKLSSRLKQILTC